MVINPLTVDKMSDYNFVVGIVWIYCASQFFKFGLKNIIEDNIDYKHRKPSFFNTNSFEH